MDINIPGMKTLTTAILFTFFVNSGMLPAQVNYNCGAGFIPRKYDTVGYNDLIDIVKTNFGFTQQFFNMKWAELQGKDIDTEYTNGIPNQINDYLIDQIHQNNIDLLISLDIAISNDRKKLNIPDTCLGVPCDRTFQDASVRQAYINEVAYIARKYQPAYFALAVEIDEYISVSTPAEGNALLQAISVAIDSVKNIDPAIKTFVYFQFENTLCKNLWSIIKPFADSSDVYGFSSFPSAIGTFTACSGASPIFGSNLPNNYYDTIATLWGNQKSIAFAELGEPSESNIILPQASEQNQKNFIEQFKISVSNLNVDFVTWIYLHDLDLPDSVGGAYFNSFGLIDTAGTIKLGYTSFKCGLLSDINDPYCSEDFVLYPNPAVNDLSIAQHCNNGRSPYVRSIQVCNFLGQIMYQYQPDVTANKDSQVKLNVENYPSGIYSVLINTDNGTISKKAIVCR